MAKGSYVVAALAATTFMLVTLGACGANESPPTDPSGQTFGSAPPTESPVSEPEPVVTTTTTTSRPSGGTTSPTYPKDARGYAQELMRAWGRLDYGRLNQLATQAAVQQIRDTVNARGNPDARWSAISCSPHEQTGFTACLFRNAHGDEALIVLRDTQIGFPTAVEEARLDRTEYPGDPASYVSNLLSAHASGNQQRVLRLSNSAVRDGLTCVISATQTTTDPVDGTHTKVTVSGLGADLGKSYAFRVLSQPAGKPNAVNAILEKTC